MSEMRYYYTDPLAAAWMAKHFGMRFGCRYDDGTFNWNPGMGALHRWQEIVRWNEFAGPVFVHPDNLHLLEPKVGDRVLLAKRKKGYVGSIKVFAEDGVLLTNGSSKSWFLKKDIASVEQRDGKPFFWPECENPSEISDNNGG